MAPKIKKAAKKKAVKKVAKRSSAPAKSVARSASPKVASGFALREILDISYAEKFKNEVMEVLEKHAEKGVTLNASSVNRITTPCVQIIIALAKSSEMAKVKFKISSPSEAFRKAFDDLGLSKQLLSWSN
jgi:chemotaxis protein CheX